MNAQRTIPFTRPSLGAREAEYVAEALRNRQIQGDGPFTRKVHAWLESHLGCARALLTHSCTGALEMAALLADLKPGDEVILPSYTFVSTATAFALRGAVPVFVDIRPDTLNIDEKRIEAAITPRTRAIVPVHYAGVGCAMGPILELAAAHGLLVIEDAAQGLCASYEGRPLGTIGQLGCLSFHETKNVVAGEGGALIINDPALVERAEIIRQKGTNRTKFLRGESDKYFWLDIGSSYLPSDLVAAVLLAQLEAAEAITARRLALWQRYYDAFAEMERLGRARRPRVPNGAAHNAHIFYLLLPTAAERDAMLRRLKQRGIHASAHYMALHDSPGGRRFARTAGSLENAESLPGRILRLPLYADLTTEEQDYVIDCVTAPVEAFRATA
ncbi:MAG: dTDP-4-amino-4,6-dideoxygalactose transaminase [Rhodospirillaceae bacterium]|nr:dTDP-4-amino-4,6-dideoxygalactose transaminase [Rhodospirillaceae bacterium]